VLACRDLQQTLSLNAAFKDKVLLNTAFTTAFTFHITMTAAASLHLRLSSLRIIVLYASIIDSTTTTTPVATIDVTKKATETTTTSQSTTTFEKQTTKASTQHHSTMQISASSAENSQTITNTIPITTIHTTMLVPESTSETTTNPTTAMEPTTYIGTTAAHETTTTSEQLPTTETATTELPELAVHCCCRCCYNVTSSPLTSCTVCGDESLADAAQCAAQPPPSPTPFTRSTEPNFEPPAQLEGSRYAERLAFTEEFLAKEQLTEELASMSLSEKTALGVTASEFILDCSFDGVPCHADMYVFANNTLPDSSVSKCWHN